jgi:hypothetical protein
MINIDRVGYGDSVTYYTVTGNVESYTDEVLLGKCSGEISYGRVFRKGRRLADVEIYQYE